jgi:hypothetical protein
MASLPEIYGESAHYFDPKEISDMAESIKKICEDIEYRQSLFQTGVEQAKKFN